jgi:chitodextrinase
MKLIPLTKTIVLFIGVFAGISTAHAAALPAGVTDTVVITDKSGVAQTNYPLQFGRPFMQGEILNHPQVRVNGVPVLTQADVKNRYPDGSVKFAVISVMVPSIAANGSVALTFQNQSSGNNAPLSKAQMLDPSYDFDARISIANSAAVASASARSMLENGDYSVWTSGPVAQTILLADDTQSRKYDMGFDALRSIRPRFQATFWPATHQVTVRYVGENSNTTSLQNVSFDLGLTLGAGKPETIYTKAGLTQAILTRWTKQAWIGGAPEQRINIDNNLPYLKATKLFPNFDTSLPVRESALAADFSSWQKSPHDLYEKGLWTEYMPTTGARADIGPFTTWATNWLYSGDWRARTVALGLADLAGAWPLQAREGDPAKRIDKAQTIPGIGLPISEYAHPSLWFPDNNGNYNQIGLPYKIALPENYPWTVDGAHQPDPYSVQYVLTGDPFYLEGMQLWAAKQAVAYCTGAPWCKGASGMAGIADQLRGNAWVFRNRTRAALWTPDNMPVLKSFFTQMSNDAIAMWEGKAGITGTAFQATPEWQWGHSQSPLGTDPLHFFCLDTTRCETTLWQHYYFMIVLGMSTEQGFATEPLLSWLSFNLTSQFADPGYNLFNLGSYHTFGRDAQANYYPSWAQYQVGNTEAGMLKNPTSFVVYQDNFYPVWAQGASSFLTSYPGGVTAWNWLRTHVQHGVPNVTIPASYLDNYNGVDQTWNFLPRNGTDTVAPSAPSGLAGSANSSTQISISWQPSTDNVGVGGYKVYRNGVHIATATGTAYTDTGLAANTAYSYAVVAFDEAGNTSAQSSSVSVTTLGADAPVGVLFSASPSTINLGQSTTLTWSSTNASSCTGVNFATGGLTSGSVKVSPGATTTYRVTCNKAGSTSGSSLSTTVTVNAVHYDLLGTDGNDTLVVAKESIHSVNGLGGYDIVKIAYPADGNSTWYRISNNADGSVTVQDVHGTGYSVVLWNVEELVFADGVHKVLQSSQ